ncbi:hypothetical protein N9B82_01015 [Saprospiraceae bacterium]|nr:hypothetical protein [Saprospiraceae bacterium]
MRLIIIVLLLTSQISAQKLVCTSFRNYPEIFIPAYPFSFKLEDSNTCKDLIYECENGRIQGVNACKFEISFTRTGPFLIKVKDTNGKVIAVKDGTVKNFPKPVAKFAEKVEGQVPRWQLLSQKEISTRQTVGDAHGQHVTTGFSYTIHRKHELLYKGNQNTERFGARIRDEIENMKRGDSIYFHDIKVVLPGDAFETTLNTISITMK